MSDITVADGRQIAFGLCEISLQFVNYKNYTLQIDAIKEIIDNAGSFFFTDIKPVILSHTL